MTTKLKPTHEVFVDTYLTNGNNATQAYLTAYPNVTVAAAGVSANRLLKNDKVQSLINERKQERSQDSFWTRENVLKEYKRLYSLALVSEGLNNAAKALSEGAKLAGLYDQSDTPMQQYSQFVTNLVLQIQQGRGAIEVDAIEQSKQEVIDQ